MKLSIIIISYNTKNLLKQCLDSLVKLKHQIIVIDNHSTDGSVEMVKQLDNVICIENKSNVGFARANNQGIKIAKGEYLLLLNSDTEVNEDALQTLISFLDKHPKVGAVTPKVVFPNGKIDPACHRGMPTPWRSLCYYAGLEHVFPNSKIFGGYHQAYLGFTSSHRIETTAATAMMVRQKTISEVGLLDEAFFLYGEDLDWCKRINDAHWNIMFVPSAQVIHHKSQSGIRNPSKESQKQAKIHFYDTMKQFYEKHYQNTYPKWLRELVYLGINLKKWQSVK